VRAKSFDACSNLSRFLGSWPAARGREDNSRKHRCWAYHYPQVAPFRLDSGKGVLRHRANARIEEPVSDAFLTARYRDLRRYGTVPHAGFGLGLECALSCVTGPSNVRDAIPFARTPGNARYWSTTASDALLPPNLTLLPTSNCSTPIEAQWLAYVRYTTLNRRREPRANSAV